LSKPLGLSLIEVTEDKNEGVYVEAVSEGSAKASGKVVKGLFLTEVNGVVRLLFYLLCSASFFLCSSLLSSLFCSVFLLYNNTNKHHPHNTTPKQQQDVKYQGFDAIMDLLIDAPASSPLNLVFTSPANVMKGPATLTVTTADQQTITIQTLKGMNLRMVLLDNGVEVYSGKGVIANCGAGGSCGYCAVSVTDNEYWESECSVFNVQKENNNDIYSTVLRLISLRCGEVVRSGLQVLRTCRQVAEIGSISFRT
jgi:ferredoxin